MTKEIELVISQLERQGARIDILAGSLGEVASHCATLLERTQHLATKEEITQAIRLHSRECRDSRLPRARDAAARSRLLRALAALVATVGAAIAAYFGFRVE